MEGIKVHLDTCAFAQLFVHRHLTAVVAARKVDHVTHRVEGGLLADHQHRGGPGHLGDGREILERVVG